MTFDYSFDPKDVIDARERFSVPSKFEPKIDEIVSQIVGFRVFQTDPRLLRLIVKWKKNKSPDSQEPDNFFKDPRKIEELKQVLSKPL